MLFTVQVGKKKKVYERHTCYTCSGQGEMMTEWSFQPCWGCQGRGYNYIRKWFKRK